MLATAIRAAKAAAEISNAYFTNLESVSFKHGNDRDIVTLADKESEERIKDIILGIFPDHGFWGEETGSSGKEKEFVWIVDPIDGTSNFSKNIPLYSISIALSHNGIIVLGVVFIPKTNELFYAEKGKGAFCNGHPIRVSDTQDMKQAMCSVTYWSRDEAHQKTGLKEFLYFAEHTKKIRYLSATIFEMCRVAKGDFDFCILDTLYLDASAASLIVEEAGGCCTLRDGTPLSSDSETPLRILTSNNLLHSEIVHTQC